MGLLGRSSYMLNIPSEETHNKEYGEQVSYNKDKGYQKNLQVLRPQL